MGLTVTGVNVKTRDGDDLTSFWIEVEAKLIEKPSPKVSVELRAYRSEADKDAKFRTLQLHDSGQGLATDVPNYLRLLQKDLTPVAYANLDMTAIHNQIAGLLEDGNADALWADQTFASQSWAGFGSPTVAVDMPA